MNLTDEISKAGLTAEQYEECVQLIVDKKNGIKDVDWQEICDKYNFSIYFSDPLIPQDIEQYANRLRNNNLHIKMFLPYEDNNGFTIIGEAVKKLDLSFDQRDLIFARDLVKTCNDMLERNEEESKYNPLISTLLSTNKYLKYDENDCKYYIDETTYKLKVFEERYSDYSKQLNVMVEGIKYYGSQEYKNYVSWNDGFFSFVEML